jgi:hypothetical protein
MIECLSKIKLEIKADPIYFLQCLEKYEVIRFQSNGWYGIFGAVNMYYLEHEQPCCIGYTNFGSSLYIQYNTDANVVNGLWNVLMRTFVFSSNLKWIIFGEKIELKFM